MRKYNIENYIRWKEDVQLAISRLPKTDDYNKLTNDQIVIKFLPLVENIARKFSTAAQASGVMTIMDFIQEGSAGLKLAVNKLVRDKLDESDDKEKTIKSF